MTTEKNNNANVITMTPEEYAKWYDEQAQKSAKNVPIKSSFKYYEDKGVLVLLLNVKETSNGKLAVYDVACEKTAKKKEGEGSYKYYVVEDKEGNTISFYNRFPLNYERKVYETTEMEEQRALTRKAQDEAEKAKKEADFFRKQAEQMQKDLEAFKESVLKKLEEQKQ